MNFFSSATQVYRTSVPAISKGMHDKPEIIKRPKPEPLPDVIWQDSLAAQFSTSLYKFARQRNWPALESSLPEIAELIIHQAEEEAERFLDHQFLKIVTLALSVQFLTTTIQNLVSQCAAVCESPIELALCFALAVVGREGERGVTFSFPDSYLGDTTADLQLTIQPQAPLGEYRVDFLITATLVEDEPELQVFRKQVIVEADGFDYHDRTKEQATRDRKRDRELQSQGFSVFRYAGSEIWASPFRCAEEIVRFLAEDVEKQCQAAELRRKEVQSAKAKDSDGRALG
jgi:very-short-patch-repair endonuclease